MQEFSLSAQIPLTYRSLPGEYLSQHQHSEGLITDHISPGATLNPGLTQLQLLLYCLKKKINPRHQKYIKQYARHEVIIFQGVNGAFYDLMSKWPK